MTTFQDFPEWQSPSTADWTTNFRSAPHSGVGIASFMIAILFGAALIGLIAFAAYLEVNTPGGVDETSTEAMIAGLCILGSLACNFLGAVLGLVGVLQRDRKKVFAVLGLVLNTIVLVSVGGILVIGLAAS